MSTWSRRRLLQGSAYAATLSLPRLLQAAVAVNGNPQPPYDEKPPAPHLENTAPATPLPLQAVKLEPSPYLTAVESNGAYLLRLESDRLLHNFRASAGLTPRAPVYGGWESESPAGHTLGHYLSACSLMFAQTGAAAYRLRVDYIVAELLQCQEAHGDGYVGGLTRKRDEVVEDGKKIFPEIQRGDIRSRPFSLNGAWSPLYTLHKLLAGLLDANEHARSITALKVAQGLGHYLEGVFAKLSDEQVQEMLACEYGGLNESFVQLHERTSDKHWLQTARRLYDRKVLEPLAREEDELEGLHSNTQIPKLIGLARLHETTGDAAYATAARFFWQTVTRNRSYVIGGNADRENFQSPLSQYITEQTCESCSTYNMLKLTRHLYQWQPQAAYFDYYERAHLNHILAQHDPNTGMFAYMMPLMSGARREFSTPFDDFWCCVGTGMESHSKHGDSIYWQRGDELLVNLYIPSEVTWKEQGVTLLMRTEYPFSADVLLEATWLRRPSTFSVSFRIPAWCQNPKITVNAQAQDIQPEHGYITLQREWSVGDKVGLKLPMRLHAEALPEDSNLIALIYGPMVLGADLGAASDPFKPNAPVFVSATTADVIHAIGSKTSTGATSEPPNLTLKPFFAQYERRSAVYFQLLTEQQWQISQAAAMAEQARARVLDARTLDLMQFGDEQSERDHRFQGGKSESVLYRGRNGRLARNASAFELRMRTNGKPSILQVTYWGRQRNSRFRIMADGVRIGLESMDGSGPVAFTERTYPLSADITRGKEFVVIRFEPEPEAGAGPVFGCRMLAAPTAA